MITPSKLDQTNAEERRLAKLQQYRILDSMPESAYDDITALAAFICDTPTALISLVGEDRQFFKSTHNFPVRETPRALSFCAHTLEDARTLVIEDATKDERFAHNALVTGGPLIRFYAGAPIVAPDGSVLGTVCVIDQKPHVLTGKQKNALEALSRQATELLEQRRVNAEMGEVTQALEKTSMQSALAIEAGQLGIFSWVVKEDQVFWENDRMYEICGRLRERGPITASDFIGHIVHPAYRDSFLAAATMVQSAGDRFHWLGKCLRPDGSTRWVEFLGLARHKESQLILFGTASDVTQRKETEEELRLERETLQMTLLATRSTTFDWDLVTDSVRWSGDPPFGRNPATLTKGAEVLEFVHRADRDRLAKAIADATANAVDHVHEIRMFWPDGSIHWVRRSGTVLRDEAGKPIRFLGVDIDITASKLSEEVFIRTEKLAVAGRLASTLSHEINNPLEAVTNLLYITRMSPTLSQQDKDHLELADRELARLSQIAAQTLGEQRSERLRGTIDSSQLMHEVLRLYHSRLTSSNIVVQLDLAPECRFDAFEGDIRQVLATLLGNAFDAMRHGGTLRIRTKYAFDWQSQLNGIAITIADTGSGVSPAIKAQIFEAFFSTKGIHGTGLGLWIAKRIIHKHEGHLRLRSSVGVPHGTVVRIWVPLEAAPSEAEAWV